MLKLQILHQQGVHNRHVLKGACSNRQPRLPTFFKKCLNSKFCIDKVYMIIHYNRLLCVKGACSNPQPHPSNFCQTEILLPEVESYLHSFEVAHAQICVV